MEIKKYNTKPTVIEVVEVVPNIDTINEIIKWTNGLGRKGPDGSILLVLNGTIMKANTGDFILRDAMGLYGILNKESLEKFYEVVK